jgi:hypothetical protein
VLANQRNCTIHYFNNAPSRGYLTGPSPGKLSIPFHCECPWGMTAGGKGSVKYREITLPSYKAGVTTIFEESPFAWKHPAGNFLRRLP